MRASYPCGLYRPGILSAVFGGQLYSFSGRKTLEKRIHIGIKTFKAKGQL